VDNTSSKMANTSNNNNNNVSLSDIERAALEAKASMRIVSRNTTNWPSLHIDRPGRIEDYYATFVDIYIAAAARCILLGVGNFMVIAANIGGVQDCLISFEAFPQAKKWGRNLSPHSTKAKTCTLPS
jgi:hypothetical protein